MRGTVRRAALQVEAISVSHTVSQVADQLEIWTAVEVSLRGKLVAQGQQCPSEPEFAVPILIFDRLRVNAKGMGQVVGDLSAIRPRNGPNWNGRRAAVPRFDLPDNVFDSGISEDAAGGAVGHVALVEGLRELADFKLSHPSGRDTSPNPEGVNAGANPGSKGSI